MSNKRYARQTILPNWADEGQNRLADSHVLIVGLGGLGNVAAMYLAGAGVGTLSLMDDDVVDVSNLPRQIAYTENQIGEYKATSLRTQIHARHPHCEVNIHTTRADQDIFKNIFKNNIYCPEVILDCTDNFATRYALNRAAISAKLPLVSGAAIRWEGQLSIFTPQKGCYACLYPENDAQDDGEACIDAGIVGPVVGTIGTLQALSTVQILLGILPNANNTLQIFDGLHHTWRKFDLKRDPDCAVCG